jgi:ribose transport system permease protein
MQSSAHSDHPDWPATLATLFARYYGVMMLALVFGLGALLSPINAQTGQRVFLTWNTQQNILFEYAEYGLLATGMTLVILTAGIDLSVGSVLGLSAVVVSLLLIKLGWGPVPAIAVCLVIATALGAINGLMITGLRMQPFVATLAMMVAARGIAKVVSGGVKVQPGLPGYALGDTPHLFDWLTNPVAGGFLRPITLLFLAGIVVMWLVVRFTRFGRYLYAIGGNEEAARLSGVRVSLVKIAAYALCALMAGLAGLSNAARVTLGDPEAGFTYELDAIAAVVIGGTSLMGGKGSVLLTLVGTLFIAYVSKILSLLGWPEGQRLIAKGAIIVVAMALQWVATYAQRRALTRKSGAGSGN